MLPIDPIGLGGAAGQDRVLAVQRVMEAMQQPMAAAEALPSALQHMQQAVPIPIQYAQATADVFRHAAGNSMLHQHAAAPSRDQLPAADPAHSPPQVTAVRSDAAALSLMPGRWMAALEPNQTVECEDAQAQGDDDRQADGQPRPAATHDDAAWRSEAPVLSFAQLCCVLRAQAQDAVLARLAQGRCVLTVLHTGLAAGNGHWAALMCPDVAPGLHGPNGLRGALKLFRARVVGSLPSLWRVRQHAGASPAGWRLLSDAGAPALWFDEQALADAPGLHIAHGQRLRLDLAKQWVMWVVKLEGDANQWEH